LVEDLRRESHPALWAELQALGNRLSKADTISDYAELTMKYRIRIGVSDFPGTGADYLRSLLAIARSLV